MELDTRSGKKTVICVCAMMSIIFYKFGGFALHNTDVCI
jgi:hypothetical protein